MSEQQQNNNENDTNRVIRVYADGVYDGFHFGHAQQLEQCKKLFPNVHLIVGVADQEETEKYKGATLMNGLERTLSVKHCKWVDEVVYPCPWIINQEFIDQNKIDYVAHDVAPYSSGGTDDIYAFVKKIGKFKETQRTDGISTSDLIMRILQNRDVYTLRNLKRGYTREQLDIQIIYLK
ncbi:hypothetical protein IMG5_181720 [Ichthyophthirius multifiliis]|uniref:choline-phosphate cytidylyltransferase n=1 Tax=Ichthyophthirius multifiliis TaxID=5932 RepID=G0R2Y3_ICHMU|nr:hypothetical protein IMG5_181720 [Ichthyophthirius multifiliis]EGR28167.1 hypothetical protein IMG5_181720 [Ichthyophthirius multifiliis]|eukprot:XP_004027512.1 hypothetical protein IMG5_181720 [Ichthyophthirius multifiliis]